MSNKNEQIEPVVRPQTGLKVQVPNTAEGRDFLEKLKQLLKVEELPFSVSCHSQPRNVQTHLEAAATSASHTPSGSTTYALDIRLEQEGWAP